MLASLSDLYLELKVILVSTSGPLSCLILHCLLTTFTTDYCLKEDVNYFDLRRLFYSKKILRIPIVFLHRQATSGFVVQS